MAALGGFVKAAVAGSIVVLTLALPAPAAVASAPVPGSPSTAPTAVTDTFETTDCPVAVPQEHADRVTCGVLTVPERRTPGSDPERTLSLPIAVVASTSREPASDPLVFPTAGGPGGGTLGSLWYFLDHADWATDDRDVILIEQRGDALSEPSLNCPELDVEHSVIDGVLLAGDEATTRGHEQIAACRDRLVSDGIDPAAYTSADSAADLADLRAALGYDQWNLYGASYGTRLALTTMRDRPEGLRAVILDGVVPPNINRYEQTPAGFTAALATLFAACEADADCGDQYPDLEQSLLSLLDRAAATPLEVTVRNPADQSPVELRLHDTDLVAGLFNALYDADLVRVLPFLIDRLAAGHVESATPLAQQNIDFDDHLTEGLNLSIDCAEEAPFNDDERIAAALAADPVLAHYPFSAGFREECEIWAVPALTDAENAPVVSAIPTLLTTGAYDPVTPAAFSAAAAEHLSAHYAYTFPGVGHGAVWATWVDDCAASVAQQFLRDPATEPDASCIDAASPTDFITADEIHPTSAIYRLGNDLMLFRDPLPLALAAFTVLVFVATLVYAAIYGLAWLRHRRGRAPGGTVLAAATSAGLNVAYVGGMVWVLMNTDPLIFGFGLPAGVWPLLIVPFAAIAASVLLIVLLVRAWAQGEGSLAHRIVLSASALASIGFAIWLLTRGLLIL